MFQIHFSFVPFQRDCHLLKQEKDSFLKKKKKKEKKKENQFYVLLSPYKSNDAQKLKLKSNFAPEVV